MLANQWNINIPVHTYSDWMDQNGDIANSNHILCSAFIPTSSAAGDFMNVSNMMTRFGGLLIYIF